MELHGARYLHILVPCPLGWGAAPGTRSASPAWPCETGLFPLFEAERRRDHSAHADPPPRARRGRTCVRSGVSPTSSPTRRAPTTSPASRRSPTATSAVSTCWASGPARGRGERAPVRDHARRRARAGRTTPAPGASSGPSTSTACRRATTPARPARTSSAGCTTPRPGTTRRRGAGSSRTTRCPRSGAGLLPPLRGGLQPGRSSTRPSASTPSSGSSATRRSRTAGGCPSAPRRRHGGCSSSGPARRASPPPTTSRGLGHEVVVREAAPRPGGMLRYGIPKYRLPREVLDAEISAIVGPRGRDPLRRRRGRHRRGDGGGRLRRGVPRRRRPAVAPRAHPGRRLGPPAGRARLPGGHGGRRSRRRSAAASSSTAAATRRWTQPAAPSGSARPTP